MVPITPSLSQTRSLAWAIIYVSIINRRLSSVWGFSVWLSVVGSTTVMFCFLLVHGLLVVASIIKKTKLFPRFSVERRGFLTASRSKGVPIFYISGGRVNVAPGRARTSSIYQRVRSCTTLSIMSKTFTWKIERRKSVVCGAVVDNKDNYTEGMF